MLWFLHVNNYSVRVNCKMGHSSWNICWGCSNTDKLQGKKGGGQNFKIHKYIQWFLHTYDPTNVFTCSDKNTAVWTLPVSVQLCVHNNEKWLLLYVSKFSSTIMLESSYFFFFFFKSFFLFYNTVVEKQELLALYNRPLSGVKWNSHSTTDNL